MHRRTAQVIIEALKHYGAIVVERSASPTLYAQRNARWKKVLPINLIQDIKLEQFEVLELPADPQRPGQLHPDRPVHRPAHRGAAQHPGDRVRRRRDAPTTTTADDDDDDGTTTSSTTTHDHDAPTTTSDDRTP